MKNKENPALLHRHLKSISTTGSFNVMELKIFKPFLKLPKKNKNTSKNSL